jgi:hypothetical protein
VSVFTGIVSFGGFLWLSVAIADGVWLGFVAVGRGAQCPSVWSLQQSPEEAREHPRDKELPRTPQPGKRNRAGLRAAGEDGLGEDRRLFKLVKLAAVRDRRVLAQREAGLRLGWALAGDAVPERSRATKAGVQDQKG